MSSLQRFFLKPQWITFPTVQFPEETFHQIVHVLRLQTEDQVKVFDNTGKEYLVSLSKVNNKCIYGKIIETVSPMTEIPIQINLFHSLLKNKAEAFLLQKTTELGVAHFFPFLSSRSVNKILHKPHFEKIIIEACEISGRVIVPVLHQLTDYATLITNQILHHDALTLLAWEEEKNFSTFPTYVSEKMKQKKVTTVNLIIGPEGGFTPQEIEQAQKVGIPIISLGKRILRADTAGIFMVSAVINQLALY